MKIFLSVAISALSAADALSLSKKFHANAVHAAGHHHGHQHEHHHHLKQTDTALKTHESVNEARLKNLNIAAGTTALVQGIALVVLYFVNPGGNLKKNVGDFVITYPKFETSKLVTKLSDPSLNIPFNYVLASATFLLLTAFSHFSIISYLRGYYLKSINNGYNLLRWIEYSITSTIMMVSLAISVGVKDLGSLLGLATCNFVTMYFGWFMELINSKNKELDLPTDWSPYIIAWISGLAPWVVTFGTYFYANSVGKTSAPTFVNYIVASYFFFFNTFAANQGLQYGEVGPWASYEFGEEVYMWLSIISKSLLAWLVFANVFSPN